jgi:hypothetical protein
MNKAEIQTEALAKAVQGNSVANYAAIFEGFAEKGIAEDDILPRENVFTFNAWKALGRVVKKGEHGVKILTVVTRASKDKHSGEEVVKKLPKTTTVFHVSQTEPLAH